MNMNVLNEWVRGLVTLVLVATCLELALPMNNMKKYVRMAMSLMVVLAICKPILGLVGQTVTVDASLFEPQTPKSLPTLAEIMRQADEFRTKNQALVQQEAADRLADEARQAAEGVDGVAEANATVGLRPGDGGKVEIGEVTVMVTKGKRAGAIRPIEPVRITMGAEPSAYRAPTQEEAQLADAIRREVASRLGVKADAQTVRIQIKGQPADQRR